MLGLELNLPDELYARLDEVSGPAPVPVNGMTTPARRPAA